MKLHRSVLIASLTLVLLQAVPAQALELYPFVGHVNSNAISGCCKSFGGSTGMGIVTRWDFELLGTLELDYFGSGPWTQISAGRPYYLLGQQDRTNEGKDQTRAVYVSDQKFIITPAVGYTSLVTKTVQYDLPVLLTGYSFNVNTQYLYSMNKDFSLAAVGQLFYIYSKSSQSWGFTLGVGLGADF